jgi:hypothetical protein
MGTRASQPSRRRRQTGAVLWLCFGLLMAGALGLHLLAAGGQAFAARERLDNAADAAAYSAALWQARVLNYQAYANRAIVAHEVAIARALAIASWARHFAAFAGTAQWMAAGWPGAAAAFAALVPAADAARDLAEQAGGEEIAGRSADIAQLVAGQELLQRAIGAFAAAAVANEIARGADPRLFAFALGGADTAPASRRHAGDDRARLADVVRRSLDGYTSGPRGLELTLVPIPSLCFGHPLAGPQAWFTELHKRGGTVLADGLDRWESADTASLHTWVPMRGLFGAFLGCRRIEALALGWGATEAGGQTGWGLRQDPGGTRFNAWASALAESVMTAQPLAGQGAWAGIASVRDLDLPRLSDPRFPVARVAVLARDEGSAVRSPAGAMRGRLALADHYAGGRLWSLSAAEVYFRAPPGQPGPVEYASLYSPYWQARLAAPTALELAQARSHVR